MVRYISCHMQQPSCSLQRRADSGLLDKFNPANDTKGGGISHLMVVVLANCNSLLWLRRSLDTCSAGYDNRKHFLLRREKTNCVLNLCLKLKKKKKRGNFKVKCFLFFR